MKKEVKKNTAKNIFKVMEKENCRQITFHYNPKTKLKIIWVIDSIPDKREKFGKLSNQVSVSGGTRFAHQDADIELEDAL